MQPDDVGGQIERFAGYLRIHDEEGRVAPLFDGEEHDWTPDLAAVPAAPLPSASVPAPAASLPPGRPVPQAPEADRPAEDLPKPSAPAPAPAPAPPPAPPVAAAPDLPPLPGPGTAAAPAPVAASVPWIDVEHMAQGSQLVLVHQSNRLEDADLALANAAAGRPDWAVADPDARLAELDGAQADAPPDAVALRAALESPLELHAALGAVSAARVDAGAGVDAEAGVGAGAGWAGDAASGPGLWVDGARAQEAPARPGPEETAEAAPRDGGRDGLEAPGLETVLGGNRAETAATIRDLDDLSGTIVVMGDVQDLSLIWQTNVLSDEDVVLAAGLEAVPEGGENVLGNVAHFEDAPSIVGPGLASRPSLAPQWQVDTVAGDLFDINLLVQHNVLHDGDLAVHQQTTGFSRLALGGNDSIAEAELFFAAGYYDVTVVGGSLIRANLVFQSNHVVDDDALRVLASPDGAGRADGGGNVLWNDAQILVSGMDAFAPLGEDALAFHDALARGDGSADLPFALPVHGGGADAGMLRVLYVEGDYVDVNVIHQTNVIHDVDAALQVGRAAGELQAGGNQAVNAAVIVDTRGQGDVAMAGGTHYDDEMLIQTNIVAEDTDVRIVDPQTLASEVIAFLDPETLAEPAEPGAFAAILGGPDADVMGGMMA